MTVAWRFRLAVVLLAVFVWQAVEHLLGWRASLLPGTWALAVPIIGGIAVGHEAWRTRPGRASPSSLGPPFQIGTMNFSQNAPGRRANQD